MVTKKNELDRLRIENATLREIARDLAWMARRYSTGRSSYAPSAYNEHARRLLEMGVELNPTGDGTIWAEDGGGRAFDGLDCEHLAPGHPVATGRLFGLPPRTKLHEELCRLLEITPETGIAEAVEKVLELKERAALAATPSLPSL